MRFRSRLFTALNLLPSTATTACDYRLREQVELTAEHNELSAHIADGQTSAHIADGQTIILAEVGNRFEVRHQSTGQPHQFDVASRLTLKAAARLDAVEVAVEIDLQNGRWAIAGTACRLRVHPVKTQSDQIELANENIDHPDRVVLGHVILQAVG